MPCYRAKTNHVSTAITRPGVGASWTNHWALVPCCSSSSSNTVPDPSSSSSSAVGGSSSSSASGGGSQPTYTFYRAYSCAGNNWSSTDCATWTTAALGSGVPIGVHYTDNNNLTTWTCNLNGGGQITYSICRIYGIAAIGQGNCTLIIKDQTITPAGYATLLGTGYQNCTVCDNNLIAIPPASSLSSP